MDPGAAWFFKGAGEMMMSKSGLRLVAGGMMAMLGGGCGLLIGYEDATRELEQCAGELITPDVHWQEFWAPAMPMT